MTRRQFTFLIIGVFFLLGFLVYGASLGNEFVRWDDGLLIYENPPIREISPWSLGRIFSTYDPELYIPLTLFSYQIDYQLGGIEPFIYHLQNLLWHIGNAILLVFVAGKLLRNKLAGILCGLLFLLHPLHTEAVAWASGRKDVLSTFWFLASLLWYLLYREREEKKWYFGSLIAFLIGLLSKVMVISLPIVLILVDDLQQRSWNRKAIMDKLPYVGLSIIFGIIAIFGKTEVIARSSLHDKILIGFRSTALYLQKIVFPNGFSVLYILDEAVSVANVLFLISIIVCVVAVIIAFVCRRKMRIIFFAIAFFFVTLLPTANNFAKGMVEIYFASDRYAYIPSIGIFLLFAYILLVILRRLPAIGNQRYITSITLCAVLFGGLGVLSYRQSRAWKNTEAVFQNVLLLYPESHIAHANIGGVRRREGDLEEAKKEYGLANAITPHAKTMSNLAAIERQQGNTLKAIELYNEAMTLNPDDADPYFGLGVVRAELGDFTEAERLYREALSINPFLEEVWSNLGTALKQQGRPEEAVSAYEHALGINPYYVLARFNLAVTLVQMGRFEEALVHYGRTVRDEPTFTTARMNYGLLLYQAGDTVEAEEQFRTVLQIKPDHASAREALRQMGVR